MDQMPPKFDYTSSMKRSIQGRERKAAEFFKDWQKVIKEAQKQGALRYQFQQSSFVTYHDTNAAAKAVKEMSDAGLRMIWVERSITKDHPRNIFGVPLHIKELRVWWHDGEERDEDQSLLFKPYYEGMPIMG